MKKAVSLLLVIALSLYLSAPALAVGEVSRSNTQELLEASIQFDGETIFYKYLEVNGEIIYAEVGNDVIEKIDNTIFVNGVKVASYSIIPISGAVANNITYSNNMIEPRTGWIWTESGNTSEYSTVYDSYIRDIALEKTLGTIAVGTLAVVIAVILPIPGVAQAVAGAVISGLTAGFSAYFGSKHLYCYETVYKSNYIGISYEKMLNQKFYYDEDLTKEVPDSEKTIFGSWG